MYMDIREYLDGSDKEDELLKLLKNMDWQAETDRAKSFKGKFSLQDGHATDAVLDAIAKHLQIS